MQINQEIFMLVAEEMSVSRAARRACVTQQCVSDHIRRLEQQHGLSFFTRKPRFQLTRAGEEMLRALQGIRIMENNMNRNLQQRAQGEVGEFTLGISSSRAQVILPWILPDFHRDFPRVSINFSMEDTVILEEKLLQGQVDLFIGVNTHYRPEFKVQPLCEDEICLILSDGLLHGAFGDRSSHILSKEADLRQFGEVPFAQSFQTGAITHLTQDYFDRNQIRLNELFHISDTETQISLCAQGLCAALCPRMLLSRVSTHNALCEPEKYIHVLPLWNFRERLRIDLISPSQVEFPPYILSFIELTRQTIRTRTQRQDARASRASI